MLWAVYFFFFQKESDYLTTVQSPTGDQESLMVLLRWVAIPDGNMPTGEPNILAIAGISLWINENGGNILYQRKLAY